MFLHYNFLNWDVKLLYSKLIGLVKVFETLNRVDNAIRVYSTYFNKGLINLKAIPSSDSDEAAYVAHLEIVLSNIIEKFSSEFDKDKGRIHKDFPHRLRFASAVVNTFFEKEFKKFILTWLDTEEKSKETFMMILHITIKGVSKFQQELSVLLGDLKIANADTIIFEMMQPFQKMYFQKEKVRF